MIAGIRRDKTSNVKKNLLGTQQERINDSDQPFAEAEVTFNTLAVTLREMTGFGVMKEHCMPA